MKTLIQAYVDWLKEKINYQEINGYFELTTPFVNHINDYIQLYVKTDTNDRIYITDDGETLSNLEMSGLDVTQPARKKELDTVLNGFGVSLNRKELTTLATPTTFPMRKHNLIQAILSVDDLFVLASPKVASFFLEDISDFLNENKVRFSSNIILQGKSTFQHKFDFVIPPSPNSPERILKAVATPKKQNIITQLFAFEDTKQARNNEGILILNDSEQEISPEVSQAVSEYGILEFPWTKREELKEKLVA